jgi:hypothetical protein
MQPSKFDAAFFSVRPVRLSFFRLTLTSRRGVGTGVGSQTAALPIVAAKLITKLESAARDDFAGANSEGILSTSSSPAAHS